MSGLRPPGGGSDDALVPPRDPRADRPVPPFGTLPVVARLGEGVLRILAPNPSAMALDGTNTYVVGVPGTGEAAIVDPGPPDPGHLARVEKALVGLDAGCRWILVTHHHGDHAEAALPWGRRLGATVAAASPAVAGEGGRLLAAGDRLDAGGVAVTVVPTPGHTADHLAFRLDDGSVLVGDHVLGRGTSVVAHPEGDLLAYLDSLRRVLDLGPSVLFPGHGPELRDDPSAVLRYYLDHRAFRERQVRERLAAGAHDVDALVRGLYADVDPRLWPAAALSTRATLEKLRAEGAVQIDPDGTAHLLTAI